jgi:hypothetical protein
MRYLTIGFAVLLASCAHNSTCGGGAPAIYQETGQCIPRIRQVMIGSDLKVPESLKGNLASLRLDWVESQLQDGQIVLGHFVLLQGGKP